MKKISIIIVIVMICSILLIGCNTSVSSTDSTDKSTVGEKGESVEKYNLTAAHVMSADTSYQVACEKFSELVAQYTNGNVTVEILSGGVLGSERDMVEGMQLGTFDIGILSSSPLSNFYPEMKIFDLPYVFENGDHAVGVVQGEIGDEILKGLDNIGLKGLGYCQVGFRNIFSKGPIKNFNDMVGKKIRIMENDIQLDTFSSFNCIPTPMAYGELFTGLQQGTVDGAENSIEAYVASRFYEVCENFTLTGHFFGVAPLIMSLKVLESMPIEYQEAIIKAGKEACEYNWEYVNDYHKELLAKAENEFGATIHEVDKAPFIESVKNIYGKYEDEVPADLLKKIKEFVY